MANPTHVESNMWALEPDEEITANDGTKAKGPQGSIRINRYEGEDFVQAQMVDGTLLEFPAEVFPESEEQPPQG